MEQSMSQAQTAGIHDRCTLRKQTSRHMRTLKHFGWMLENGALVREMLPVYPSFTYPCHVSIMTGCYPDKHGIPHNEQVKAGVHPVPWYTSRNIS